MRRTYQYIQRWANIYLTTIPGHYRQRKIEILQNLFNIVNIFLRESGEDYWLDFGTLLGYHRAEGIIPHDIDIDFGMHEKSYLKIIALKDKIQGEMKFFDTSKNHRGPKVYFSYKGFDADIYFYEDLGDSIRSYERSSYENETSEIPKKLVFPLSEAIHLSQQTFIPSNTKVYLENLYGYIGKDAIRDKETGFWKKRLT